MDFEFSVTDQPVAAPSFAVRSIYHVLGDREYDVWSPGTSSSGHIALRTFRGKGNLDFGEGPAARVEPDTLLIFPFKDLRRYRCLGKEWIFWWFHFDACSDIGIVPRRCHHIAEVSSESALCREAVEKLSSRDPLSRSAASVIFARLHSLWLTSLNCESATGQPRRHAADAAVEYLQGHYATQISIGDLADLCNLSVRRFQDLFSESTGMPPSTYLTRLRLSAAKEYLANTNLTIKEIAARTGFCNEYYLSRRFKKEIGIPPGGFRSSRGVQ